MSRAWLTPISLILTLDIWGVDSCSWRSRFECSILLRLDLNFCHIYYEATTRFADIGGAHSYLWNSTPEIIYWELWGAFLPVIISRHSIRSFSLPTTGFIYFIAVCTLHPVWSIIVASYSSINASVMVANFESPMREENFEAMLSPVSFGSTDAFLSFIFIWLMLHSQLWVSRWFYTSWDKSI